MVECLGKLGVQIETDWASNRLRVFGTGGKIPSGDAELFHDQIVSMVNKNKEAGVKLDHQITPSQFHVFQLLSPLVRDSRIAVRAIGEFINRL